MTKAHKRRGKAVFDAGAGFLGLPAEQRSRTRSRALVLPIPYEGTVSYGCGARFGPRAIIDASASVEPFDRKAGCEPAAELGICTLPAVAVDVSGPEAMVERIAASTAPLYREGRFVLALGGEHTVTAGLVRAAAGVWPDLCIVQVDAHADLRSSFQGSPFSHACVMRRALEELRSSDEARLVQVGIRNISGEELAFAREQEKRIRTFWADDIVVDRAHHWLADIEEIVQGRNVYLTVDVDGLDSSLMPSTGTPEPGGLDWYDILGLVERLSAKARLVAADIVELAPQPGNHAPDFLVAKIGYRIVARALGVGGPRSEK